MRIHMAGAKGGLKKNMGTSPLVKRGKVVKGGERRSKNSSGILVSGSAGK